MAKNRLEKGIREIKKDIVQASDQIKESADKAVDFVKDKTNKWK